MSLLFHIDNIVVGGQAVAFEDASATISGAHRFENTVVPSATGDDFASRRRVPTTIRMRIQFTGEQSPQQLTEVGGVQITARDTSSGRRAMFPKCRFGSMGDLGGGAVDVTYLVLAEAQWL